MYRDLLLRGVLIVLTSGGLAAVAPPDQPVDGAQSSLSDASKVRVAPKALKDTPDVMAAEGASALKSGAVAMMGADGSVAVTPPGTQVYKNDLPQGTSLVIYQPGAGQRMADDLTLANGGCTVTYYLLRVGGLGTTGTFDVHTALWNGDPCVAGSTIIAGTESDFLGVPNNQTAFNLEVTLDPTVPVPATVWLAATFSTNDSGWVRAGQAEVGSTTNFWSENNIGTSGTVCSLFQFVTNNVPGVPWAGFWASVNCTVPGDPVGACCNGITCTQTTQVNCAAGVWQGAFTSCQPNVCISGACCTGVNFSVCTDTTQDQCIGGLFHAGSTCAADACGPTFKVYENSFATGFFDVIATGTKWGDDLKLGSGAPCELAGYEVLAAGDGAAGPPPFNAHVELWTNNDRGTPAAEGDDIPGVFIPGTQFDFQNVPADLFTQRLLAGPYAGIQLPKKVWVVMTTNSNKAGPITAGPASIGFSVDGFAIFNADVPGGADVWKPGFWYEGFDPTGCPGGAFCTPAGSFRVQVWCQGNPPTGACCNDAAGTCIEGVRQAECNGRWAEGVGCDPDPFVPPCGVSACCYPISPDPPVMICQDATLGECEARGVEFGGSAFSRGKFCGDVTCPAMACLGRTGDCFAAHAGVGCEDAFCCDIVCNPTTGDSFCCTTEWDLTCAQDAAAKCDRPLQNDNCPAAQVISGTGTFNYDNSSATTDGPVHLACGTLGGDEQITRDMWYCWTSPCTNEVLAGTCGATLLDTKVAVYDSCVCPPTDATLLDCDDDRCDPRQSMAVFNATAGHSYLIRVGSYPGEAGGTGAITIQCGPPANPACTGATGDCCAANPSGACSDALCCNTVCACDPFCCTTEWDNACATTGSNGNQCGAGELCEALCSPTCPAGAVNWLDPPTGVVDARRPHPSNDSAALEGIKVITVQAPAGSNKVECWQLCETAVAGTPNGVESVTDEGRGRFKITLKRPITAGAGTTLTYAGGGAMATFTSHPSNVNADSAAAPVDILDLIDFLNGVRTLPFGLYSGDIDRSNLIAPADILEEIDLLNGAGQFRVWNGTAKPVTAGICP
jgi:hypothetical protein